MKDVTEIVDMIQKRAVELDNNVLPVDFAWRSAVREYLLNERADTPYERVFATFVGYDGSIMYQCGIYKHPNLLAHIGKVVLVEPATDGTLLVRNAITKHEICRAGIHAFKAFGGDVGAMLEKSEDTMTVRSQVVMDDTRQPTGVVFVSQVPEGAEYMMVSRILHRVWHFMQREIAEMFVNDKETQP